ncbi:hypothetical protein NE237_003695 [Protea cynaroides]|uniref:Uncharacterized protein n=1 Tax=Protea cynaroides TaxID=273540 RepID=A0A9Q0KHX2_9MAGN|nr:hypothetical protein NE237_003695 [Protea cynaroides]
MGFFDLNVPYLEGGGSEKFIPDKSGKKNARLKLLVKAMEMGYTGVAYNRFMSGVMSDSDRCTISLFPLSSLLKAAPTLSASVTFHREILGVPLNSPFRQYTRLTVSVDTPRQADALNSGNPVLKSYDLVAVCPLNQLAFERACKLSEVDIIAIDFSQRLPFRLKLPLVKAAMERGIYFEIVYTPLISDVLARRQLISNAKLLVDWTRGKNLIISSASLTANELRGPYDVANLSTLLGLSMERAKEAISKNCRALVANALRKKQWFKEAIKIERISPGKQLNSKEHWLVDWHDWDGISSGEGDLMLEDITKFFSASTGAPKTSKTIDFTSIAKAMLPNDMQLKDLVSGSEAELQTPTDNTGELLSTAKEFEGSDVPNEISKHSSCPSEVPDSTITITPSKQQTFGSEDCFDSSPDDKLAALPDDLEMESTEDLSDAAKGLGGLDVFAVGTTPVDSSPQECITNRETVPELPHKTVLFAATIENSEPSTTFNAESIVLPSEDCIATIEGDLMPPIAMVKDSERPKYVILSAPNVTTSEVLVERDGREACDAPLPKDSANRESHEESGNAIALPGDEMQLVAPCGGMHGDVVHVADDRSPEEVLVEMKEQREEHSIDINRPTLDKLRAGKGRRFPKVYRQAFPFPLKRLLKPVLFKKKYRNLKQKMKMV